MTLGTVSLFALALLAQQKPAKPKPPTDGSLAIEKRDLASVLTFSKDGKYLAVMDYRPSSKVFLYDAATFKEVRTLEGLPPCDFNDGHGRGGGRDATLQFSPDSKLLVALRALHQFKFFMVWDVATGKVVGKLPTNEYCSDAVGFSRDGKEIVLEGLDGDTGKFERKLKTWSLENGEISPKPKRDFKFSELRDIVFDATGARIFLMMSERGYQVADPLTGEVLEEVESKIMARPQFAGVAQCAELSPNGKLLAIGSTKWGTSVNGQGRAGLMRVWDLEKKEILWNLEQPSQVGYVAFSADGKLVAANSMGTINIYDVATGKLQRSITGVRGTCNDEPWSPIAFRRDDGWLAGVDVTGVRLWKPK